MCLGLPFVVLGDPLSPEDLEKILSSGFLTVPYVPFYINGNLEHDLIVKPTMPDPTKLVPPLYPKMSEPLIVPKPGIYVRSYARQRAIIDLMNKKQSIQREQKRRGVRVNFRSTDG